MTKTVAPTTDTNESEFEQYMADNLAKVKRGSALWRLYEKESQTDQLAIVDRADVISKLFPEIEPPAWAELDETIVCRAPADSYWLSAPIKVFTRRAPSKPFTDPIRMQLGHLKAQLAEKVTTADPFVQIEHWGMYVEGEHLEELSRVRLTLSEAAELAHSLLMLLDVAGEA